MSQLFQSIRKNIYLLEILELFGLCLLWIIWGVFDGRSVGYIAQLVFYSYIILIFAWAFYLLMIFIWRSESIWLIVGLGILSGGIAVVLYVFLGLFDLNRLLIGKYLYIEGPPLEFFWNKESSARRRLWIKSH